MADGVCMDCDGAGEIADDGGDMVTCTACNGTGTVEYDEEDGDPNK